MHTHVRRTDHLLRLSACLQHHNVHPLLQPTFRVTAAPKPHARTSGGSELEGVLNGLANMQLGAGERQVLGERHNLVNVDSPAQPKDGGKSKGKAPAQKPEVIELSSDELAEIERVIAEYPVSGGRYFDAAAHALHLWG